MGECGGKNYHLIHKSADLENVAYCSVRGAIEYSGQKCSATARMYVPESCWPEVSGHGLVGVGVVLRLVCGYCYGDLVSCKYNRTSEIRTTNYKLFSPNTICILQVFGKYHHEHT